MHLLALTALLVILSGSAQAQIPGVGYGGFGGTWNCGVRGIASFVQEGEQLRGTFQGTAGQHWGSTMRNGGQIIAGVSQGYAADMLIKHGDNTYVVTTITLNEDQTKFSGTWVWCNSQGINRQTRLCQSGSPIGTGNWTCDRAG